MAALLSPPLLGPREWRLSSSESGTWLLLPRKPQCRGRSRSAPPLWRGDLAADPRSLLEVPGGGEEERLSIPPGQVLLALLGLGGWRGADLRWSACDLGSYLSHQPQPCTEPAVGAQPHSVLLRRAAGSLFFHQFPPLHFSHLVGGEPREKQRSSGFPHTRALLLERGLSSGLVCSHNSWVCGLRRVD